MTAPALWLTLGLTAGAYLLGSLPFGVWVGYALTGRDIRAGGSGHTGASNTIRQAGWAGGVAVAALDVGKGAVAVWLASQWGDGGWTTALAAAAVVAGHCWPVFAGFRGGMGLATAGGAVLAAYPLGFAAGLGLLIAAAFVLKHSARAGFAAGLLFPGLLWLLSGSPALTGLGAAVGGVVILRAFSDWNHQRRGVWTVTRR
ncbi:MAG: glycerol-3-phosphate acyltransferase [Anaerolineales bacterium]|nr:glycerol-3-phosphate acyltransferase [Anaerolineales bacterium]